MALQASPGVVAIGATITLRGTHFSPHSFVGLSIDRGIPILDTAGSSVVRTDAQGNFTDTVVALADWHSGSHTLHAEDSLTHKAATFSIKLTGNGQALRPAHLRTSSESFDFGVGDTITNSVKTLMLLNTGGGQISWQARSNHDWLKISPTSGSFVGGQDMHISVAVDRSHASPGVYMGQITFTSNAGNNVLAVRMEARNLRPLNMGALGVTPPVLSYIAHDGGASPSPQDVTLFNPGVGLLTWDASADVGWLKVLAATNTLVPGESKPLRLAVDSHAMLPGVYRATVTVRGFGMDGQEVPGSIQKIYVVVTVTQGCLLQTVPNTLSFSGMEGGTFPATQTLKISALHSCPGALNWSVSSDAKWLHLSTSNGTTPSSLAISVDTSALQPAILPATYSAALSLSSATGVQVLPVTLTLNATPSPAMTLSSTHVSLSALTSQDSPAQQSIVLTNTGKGQLTWKATTTTTSGGSWLSVSPASGTLEAGASQQLSLSAMLPINSGSGVYNGTLTLSGTDSIGSQLAGGMRTIPISLTVRSSCALSVGSGSLTFTTSAYQTTAVERTFTLSEQENCDAKLAWRARVTSGGNWLQVSDQNGTLTPGESDVVRALVTSSQLAPGTYRGSIAVTSYDRQTGQDLGAANTITVTLMVGAPCSVKATTPSRLDLTPQNASGQFTVSVSNTCMRNVIFMPEVAYSDNGNGWLTIMSPTSSVAPGDSVTFMLTVDATGLGPGTYTATIQLDASTGGSYIEGNPQTLTVTFTVPDITTPGSSPTP
ncbi:hypothetical protein KSX_26010 [Ktedonospora formicarum]|uniref:BACON domain-containing protein n=2 Tax=Ktedonospora formicarum TaxID=2778364 RepID=A0A8J3I0I7_9CHLR|nr:hypothetical protein KSX_26010 [Ktedonospora formicarum]